MAWFQEMKLKEFSLLSSLSHYNVKNGDQTVVLTASRCPDILTTSSRWIHLMWQNYRRKIWELVIYFAESIHFQSAFLQSQCLKEMENLDWLLLKKYLGARVPSPIIWCQIRSLRKLILAVCNLFFFSFWYWKNRTRSKLCLRAASVPQRWLKIILNLEESDLLLWPVGIKQQVLNVFKKHYSRKYTRSWMRNKQNAS